MRMTLALLALLTAVPAHADDTTLSPVMAGVAAHPTAGRAVTSRTTQSDGTGTPLSPVMAGEGPPSTTSLVQTGQVVDADLRRHDDTAAPPATPPAAPPAETTRLPEVVVTATRIPTEVEAIPAGVTVITRQQIDQRGYNTLADALQTVPGMHLSQSGGPGGQTSVFMRGTGSNHVLVLRDGMPINDATDPGGAFNFGVDTLEDVERIEVIRGPMAALYGSGAVGGVINLISRRGRDPGLHIDTGLSGGYPAQIRAAVTAHGTAGKFDYAATAESQSQRGYDATPQRESVYTGTPQGFRDRIGTLNLGYSPVEGTRLSLFFRARQAIFGFNELGLAGPTLDTANATGRTDSLLGRIGATSRLFDGLWETRLFLGHLQEDRSYRELFDPRDPSQATADERYHAYRTDLQWNNTLHLDRWLDATALTFGYQRTEDRAKVRINDSSLFGPFTENVDAHMTDDALHFGAQRTLWQVLTLTGQIRQEWVAGSQPFTWRLGATLDVDAIDTKFKAAYGTAFRAPSLFDRFGVSPFFTGNPSLRPERAQGWEAGFTTTLPALKQADFVSFGATYFNQQVQDLIAFAGSTEINVGSAHVQGIETELTLHPLRWLTLQASWTFTDAQNADTRTRLTRRPQHAATVSATATPLPGLSIVPELAYTGAFKDDLIGNDGIDTGTIGTSPHGLVANLTVTYDVSPKVQLYAHGANIFGSRFEPVNGFQIPGPIAIAGVRLHL